jgi:hypothetical protein
MKASNTARLVCRAPAGLDLRLREAAGKIGVTESQFMRLAIEEKIARTNQAVTTQEIDQNDRPAVSNPEPTE